MANNSSKKSSSKSGSAKKAVPLKEKEVPRSEDDLSDIRDYTEYMTMVIATRERRFTFEDVTATDDHRPIAAKEFEVKKPGNLLALMAYNDQEDDPEVYENWDAWENDS